MDLGNIVYIIAVIAYFIYQASKKKKAAAPPSTGEEDSPSPTVSFEDLLKEIRGEQEEQAAPRSEPVPEPVRSPTNQQTKPQAPPQSAPYSSSPYENQYDDEIMYYEDAFEMDAFEKIKKEEERIKKVAASIPSQRDVSYKLKKARVSRYAEILRDKEQLKDAFVLNEILKKKF